MAFKLTKYSYKSLRQMSVQDRLAAAQDKEMGQWLLSLLTPSQFIELFPDYYRRSLPDISGFIKAMPSSMSAAKQAAMEEQLQNTASGSAAGANMRAGGWRKKWQEGINRAIPTKAGVVPPPQLSPEQRKAFDDLRSSPMAVDDPRAKMFAGLSDQQLSQVGISKVKESGKEYLKYTSPVVTEEDVKKYAASGQRGGNSFFNAIIKAEGTAKQGDPYETSLGYMKSPKPLTEMTMAESLEWGDTVRKSQGLNSSAKGAFQIVNTTQREAMKALGIGMDEKFSPENQRRMAAWIVQQQGLGAWEGLKLHRDQWQIAESAMAQGLHRQYADGITTDYSPKSMELAKESLIRQQEEKRIGDLAAFTTANMPISTSGGLNPTPGTAELTGGAETKGDAISYMMRVVNRQEHSPEDKALIKEFLQKGGHGLDPEQYAWCAATIGSALRQAGIKDIPAAEGGNVATSYLNWGRGVDTSKENVSRGDVVVLSRGRGAGQTGGHVAMATGQIRRNASGELEIQVVEGNRDNRGNLGWYTVGEQGMQIRRAREGVEVQTAPQVQGVPPSQPNPPAAAPMAPAPSVETPRVTNKPGTIPQAEPAPTSSIPAPAPAAPAPSVETPQVVNKSSAVKYKFNEAAFVAEVRAKETGAFFVSDDYILNELRKGFKDTPGVSYKNGVLTVDDPKSPAIQQVLNDMKTHNFDSTKFMNQIKEEKKPEVKPVQQKVVEKSSATVSTQPTPPVDKPSSTSPAQPAPSVETPKVENKTLEPPKEAPSKVKTNAAGGDNRVNTEQISAYPIGGLKGDNVVVVNKQQQPLFTMNTNESITMNPKTDMATVTPSGKERNVGAAPKDSFVSDMFGDFNQSVRELASKFDQNKPVPERQDRPDTFTPEGGNWLNNLNKLTEKEFHSPSARRAFYRAGGSETGEPHSGFHFSHGNRS